MCLCISSIICFELGKIYKLELAIQIGNIGFASSLVGICIGIVFKIFGENDQKLMDFLKERIDEDKIPDTWIRNSKLTIQIKFALDGGIDSNKLKDIGEELSDLYKLPLLERVYKPGEIVYTLAKENYYSPLICKQGMNYSVFFDEDKRSIQLDRHLTWNFDKHPHALITGSTGSGKSQYIMYLTRVFASMNASKITILDAKGAPDLKRLADDLEIEDLNEKGKILKKLREVTEDMEQRYKDMKEAHCDYYYQMGEAMPVYCLILEEVSALQSSLDVNEEKEFSKRLNSLVLLGRQAGIVLILTLQRADVSFMGKTGGAIRDQLGLRVCLSGSADGMRMVFGADTKRPVFREPGEGLIQITGMESPRDYKAPRMLPG